MREKGIQKLEVHVAGICFNEEGKVLILKRSLERKLYPGFWECGGGQVEPEESFEKAIIRQMKEEAGIIVKMIAPVCFYEIKTKNKDQKLIPGIRVACEIVKFINGKEPKIGEEHTEWKFVSKSELNKYKFAPGVLTGIKKAYKMLKKFYLTYY